MTQPAKSQEPSMEEILASIRRIIADDDPAKSQPKASEPAMAQPAPVPPPRPAPPPPRMAPPPPLPPPPEPEPEQDEIDSMLAQLEQVSRKPPPSVEESASDILDLTEQMAAPEEAPAFRTIDGQSDVVFEETLPEPEPPPPPPPPPRMAEPPRHSSDNGDRGLMSASTSAAVDSAFNTLAQTVLVQNGRTLEDLVREMLRPMLKTWLDDNLPGMVERLVRAEIERVSRGRG